jgi:TonB-dependent starch-binding outer membrane protein SusC
VPLILNHKTQINEKTMKEVKKQKKQFFIRLMLSFLFTFSAFSYANAQVKTITGTVKDESGETIIGASVLVKGTTVGSITGVNGDFKLNIPANGKSIVVTYIGMVKQELPITGNVINVVLKSDAKGLDEVVVVGYGTQKKRDLTGSVSSVQGTTLSQVPVTSAGEALTGRLAGVQITTADGSPDAELIIRVRGGGSVTGDNSPLYIVDGFPANNINDIAPGDIQSIDVLKDASTTAIYGSRGSNGVVIITTKSAQGGRTQVSYNGFMQVKKLSKRLSVLSPYEYVKLNYELAAFDGATGISNFEKTFGVWDDLDLYKYQKGHDWQDDMFGSNVISQQHNINITGGNDKTKFSLSTTYNKDGGLMVNNDYSRFNTNFKLNHEIAKNLKASFNTRISDTKVNGSGTSGGNYKVRTSQAVTSSATNGLSGMTSVDLSTMSDEEKNQYLQSIMSLTDQAAQYWKRSTNRTFNFTGSLDWEIIKKLVYRIEGGYEYGFNDVKNYWGQYTSTASYVDGNPLVDWTKTNTNRSRLANTLTYQFNLGNISKFDVMVGQEINIYNYNNNFLYATGFGTDLTPDKIFANLGLGGATKNLSSFVSTPEKQSSFFGRINYNLMERYLLTATFRADGSSKFATGKNWGYFPAAAAAWRVSEEPFLESSKDWLSNLKLRLSYGEVGNDRIGNGQYLSTYSIQSTKTYGIGDIQNNYYGTTNLQMTNPNLRWETTITRNAGLDFGFFNERLTGSVEVYQNTTRNLLIEVPIVAPGYKTTMENVGQTSNKGIEVSLNATILNKKDYSLGANFNIAFNQSNVDKLANGITVQEYASNWGSSDLKGTNDYRVVVGQPVGLIYGYQTDGYYTTSDFDSYNSATGKYVLKAGVASTGILGGKIGIRPGTIKFKDISGPNGIPDGVVDDNDRTIIGKTAPKFTGGFGLNGTFHGFDASLLFNFVYGNQIYNANKIASSQQYRTTNPNLLGFMSQNNRYTYLNDNGQIVTDLATLAAMNEGANAKQYWSPFSFGNSSVACYDWAVEDGSFLRLQNVSIGYTIPARMTKQFKCERLRLYCTLNNVWILTNYSGYDPEVNSPVRGSSTSGLTPGVDYSSYPKSFSWTFGVNVTF